MSGVVCWAMGIALWLHTVAAIRAGGAPCTAFAIVITAVIAFGALASFLLRDDLGGALAVMALIGACLFRGFCKPRQAERAADIVRNRRWDTDLFLSGGEGQLKTVKPLSPVTALKRLQRLPRKAAASHAARRLANSRTGP